MKTQTPKDLRSDHVDDWISWLDEHDIDLHPIANVVEQTEILRNLTRESSDLRRQLQNAPSPRAAAAAALARGEDYSQKSVKAKTITADTLQEKLDILEAGEQAAADRVWSLLVARSAANLDLLRPLYLATANRMIELRAVLGSEPISIEVAARRGQASEWLELEASFNLIEEIRDIHAQWLADGIVRRRGIRSKSEYESPWDRYSFAEFYYADRVIPHVADGGGAYRASGAFAEANLFHAAGPELRSIAQIDEKWSNSPQDEDLSSSYAKAISSTRTVWDADRENARAKYEASIGIALPPSGYAQNNI